jgi:hypothetical protein
MGCDVDIRIDNQGDVNIYNCTDHGAKEHPKDCPECPPRAEGACVPLGLGCKPKQSKRRKLEQLQARNEVPSVLAASFFQTARRFLGGKEPANDFERDVFPAFQAMPRDVRDILACAVDSFESTSSDLRNAGLEPSILADPDKPVDTGTLTAGLLKEIELRASDAVFGNAHALEAERPGRNRFFDPGGEIFFAQLQICRMNNLRTASFRPAISLGDYLPAEIQQHCELVLVGEEIQQNCSVLTGDCPGNKLPDDVCARVLDVANGDAVVVTGVNFMRTDMKVRLKAKEGTATAEVDAYVFGDLDTPLKEEVNGVESIIQDCRVKDRLTFVVPEDLPPGVYELQLALTNTTGIEILGPTILSNFEFINVLPPETARFQVVAERLLAREETAPASFGSDEVALTVLAAELLADGTTSSIQRLRKRFDDVDSGNSRNIESVVFSQSQPMVGMALTIIGYEVDSERAFNQQIDSFEEAFVDYLSRAWDKFKEELVGGAGGVIKALGLLKGAIAIAIAAVLALAVIAIVAYWAPADLIMDDAIGFSVVELAELTNANVPAPVFTEFESPQGLKASSNPVEKGALTYREFREYHSEEEESRYDLFLRYNRIA